MNLQEKLALACRILAMQGHNDMIYGHVSALTDTPTLGAALDVFEHEPLPADSPLWSLPNVLVTPHIAGFRPDHWDAVTALFADNLRRFESGQPLLNVVNKEAGY